MPKKKKGQRSDGSIEIKRTMPDGKARHFYGQSRAECEEKYKQALLTWQTQQAEDASGPLFTAVADKWWIQKEPELRHGTLRCYKPAVRRAKEAFEGKLIKDIAAEDIAALLARMKAQGLAAKTIANTHCVLTMIFEYAAVNHGLKSNPSTLVSTPKAQRAVRKPPTELQERIIRQAIRSAIEAGNVSDGVAMAALYMYTGVRRGEGLALQWRDVDLDQKEIAVYKSVEHRGNRPVVGETKTENGIRTVPLLPALEALLEIYRGSAGPADYVIGGQPEPLSYGQYNNRWEGFCRDIGLSKPSDGQEIHGHNYALVTPHQLRHLYATELYRAGIPMEIAVRMMGHADSEMIKRVYLDVNASMLQEAASKLMAQMQKS